MADWKKALLGAAAGHKDRTDFENEVKTFIHENVSEHSNQPIDLVQWVPIGLVEPNDYNPNSVATREFDLLYTSVSQDGYTQPIVTIWDDERQKYIIIDGFHRYSICTRYSDILVTNNGHIPIVVLKKSINDRMAATIRHNRARGSHSVDGMASLVFRLLENGWGDDEICQNLGMSADELVRLKHVTGFSALFKNTEYGKAWKTRRQIRVEQQARAGSAT